MKDSTLPILYSFRRCPYAMRARMAIAYAGLTCELREVVLRDKPESMIHFSAKGEVPVLVVEDVVIDESLHVMDWALAQADPDGWREVEPDATAALVKRFDNGFKPILDRYKYFDRHPQKSQEEYRIEAIPYLEALDKMLSAHEYLMGDMLSFADVALLPFIRQFAHVDKAWFDASPFNHLIRWLDHLLASPLFLSVMQKYPQWHPGDEEILFPPATSKRSS